MQARWWPHGDAGHPGRVLPLGTGWAALLLPLSWLYRAAFILHRAWARREAAHHHAQETQPVPTLVVGNWVVGGAGKTPTALAVLAHLKDRGWHPGVVSRGYGRRNTDTAVVDPQRSSASDVGDEPLLVARRARVPVVVGRDRRAARALLLQEHPRVDIVVADDGLQHHRLWRDLEIVVVDERGAGNGQCLPAGPLREPLPHRLGAGTLVLYSAGVASLGLPGEVAQRRLSGVQTLQAWHCGEPLAPDGGWAALRGRPLHAAAGIAVPERFFESLRQQGLELAATHALADHASWADTPWPSGATDAVVTEKDAVKLAAGPAAWGGTQVWVARLDLELPARFKRALDAGLPPKPPHPPR